MPMACWVVGNKRKDTALDFGIEANKALFLVRMAACLAIVLVMHCLSVGSHSVVC